MKKYLLMIMAAMAAMTMDAQVLQVYKGDASSPIYTMVDADSVVWSQQLPSEADTTAYSAAISLNWTATNYAMQYNTIVRDGNQYYYLGLWEDNYYEEWIAGGGDDHGLNESIIGWIEASYYYENYVEITPYQIATTYCKRGNVSSGFTALTKNTKYEIIAFVYDYENNITGDVTYVWHVQTTNEDPKPDYPVDMTIELTWNSTTLTATPSLTTQKYLFDAVVGSAVSSYTTADELAQAVLESYGGSISSSYCSTGTDSYNFYSMCSYYSDEDTIVGFAFGVGTDGKICSQPVWAKIANPYYSSSSGYDDYWSPARKATDAEQKAAIARIYKDGKAQFVVANADSILFVSEADAPKQDTLKFDVKVTDINSTSAFITVTPSDTSVYYRYEVVDSAFVANPMCGDGSVLGAAQYIMASYKSAIDSYNESYSTEYTFLDFPSYHAYKGQDKGSFSDLASGTEYYVIAFKATAYCDVIDEPLSPLVYTTFRTKNEK